MCDRNTQSVVNEFFSQLGFCWVLVQVKGHHKLTNWWVSICFCTNRMLEHLKWLPKKKKNSGESMASKVSVLCVYVSGLLLKIKLYGLCVQCCDNDNGLCCVENGDCHCACGLAKGQNRKLFLCACLKCYIQVIFIICSSECTMWTTIETTPLCTVWMTTHEKRFSFVYFIKNLLACWCLEMRKREKKKLFSGWNSFWFPFDCIYTLTVKFLSFQTASLFTVEFFFKKSNQYFIY